MVKKNCLDLMPINNLVEFFIEEEKKTINSIQRQKTNITEVISQIIHALCKGKKIIYVGAGTSGRLGILDAVECKPTFSTGSFEAIIAGGNQAMFKAKEGAEDNLKQGIRDLQNVRVKKGDIVIGISASGETPYTISAIKYAKRLGAVTVGISSRVKSTLPKIADFKICPEIKDEMIAGSSRLRSGTTQKIILNMLSSISMIKIGKVYDNFMIDVQPTNKKLIKRAIGIISIVCKVPLNKAKLLFKKSRENTKIAIVMYKRSCNFNKANKLLASSGFNLRKVIS